MKTHTSCARKPCCGWAHDAVPLLAFGCRDGGTMDSTDFDLDLVFDAVTFEAASGLTATAIEGSR